MDDHRWAGLKKDGQLFMLVILVLLPAGIDIAAMRGAFNIGNS